MYENITANILSLKRVNTFPTALDQALDKKRRQKVEENIESGNC